MEKTHEEQEKRQKQCQNCRNRKALADFPRKLGSRTDIIGAGDTCTLCCIELRREPKSSWCVDTLEGTTEAGSEKLPIGRRPWSPRVRPDKKKVRKPGKWDEFRATSKCGK